MKVMLNAPIAVAALARLLPRTFCAIMSLVVLLPLASTSTGGWRILRSCCALCFTVLTTLVVRAYGMQSEVGGALQRLSARASDPWATSHWMQSFVRIDAEVAGLALRRRQTARGAECRYGHVGTGDRDHACFHTITVLAIFPPFARRAARKGLTPSARS